MTNEAVPAPLERVVRGPRVLATVRKVLHFEGRYKGHDILIERAHPADNWYIQVRGPDGCFCYDGWWPESARKTQREAVLEALEGSLLWTPNRY